MTTARTIGLGCGLVFLLGVGAATLSRAQHTAAKNAPPPSTRNELRERVVKLRTEIDLLQMEYDVARANLLDWLKGFETADLMGIDYFASAGKMRLTLSAASTGDPYELMSKAFGDNKEEAQKQGNKIRSALERKKSEFAKKARLLIEKRLDLTEAENQYQREAR